MGHVRIQKLVYKVQKYSASFIFLGLNTVNVEGSLIVKLLRNLRGITNNAYLPFLYQALV